MSDDTEKKYTFPMPRVRSADQTDEFVVKQIKAQKLKLQAIAEDDPKTAEELHKIEGLMSLSLGSKMFTDMMMQGCDKAEIDKIGKDMMRASEVLDVLGASITLPSAIEDKIRKETGGDLDSSKSSVPMMAVLGLLALSRAFQSLGDGVDKSDPALKYQGLTFIDRNLAMMGFVRSYLVLSSMMELEKLGLTKEQILNEPGIDAMIRGVEMKDILAVGKAMDNVSQEIRDNPPTDKPDKTFVLL